jgi:hypothetical protein
VGRRRGVTASSQPSSRPNSGAYHRTSPRRGCECGATAGYRASPSGALTRGVHAPSAQEGRAPATSSTSSIGTTRSSLATIVRARLLPASISSASFRPTSSGSMWLGRCASLSVRQHATQVTRRVGSSGSRGVVVRPRASSTPRRDGHRLWQPLGVGVGRVARPLTTPFARAITRCAASSAPGASPINQLSSAPCGPRGVLVERTRVLRTSNRFHQHACSLQCCKTVRELMVS